jgi:hypothetical protein
LLALLRFGSSLFEHSSDTIFEKNYPKKHLEADARPEVEAIRQQLSTDAAAKLRSERENLQVRKADVTAKLNLELQREQALQRRAELIRRALSR